ncbi:phosphoglycerate mutase family protein [Zhongshania borealis]|uniref:Histidine phosphatase family protein n=1 Tax=Zhongshania borealis TaxID=889488 RepID=A0ABP7WNA3_9GAMM
MPRQFAALVRHGEYRQLANTPSAHQGFPLTEYGCDQARDGAAVLAALSGQHRWQLEAEIDCSTLLRAWQTASLFSAALQANKKVSKRAALSLASYDALAERGLGSAANLSVDAIAQIIDEDPRFPALPADWKCNSYFQLPLLGAESLMMAGQRVASHIQQQMDALASPQTSATDGLKIFIGHGAAFRHAAYHLGVLKFDDIAGLSMHHCQPIVLEHLGAGRWQHFSGSWKLRGAKEEVQD